jgi:hypothetical protein
VRIRSHRGARGATGGTDACQSPGQEDDRGTDVAPWPPADPEPPPAVALPQAATTAKAPPAIVASAARLAAPTGHLRRTISLTSTTGRISRATLEESSAGSPEPGRSTRRVLTGLTPRPGLLWLDGPHACPVPSSPLPRRKRCRLPRSRWQVTVLPISAGRVGTHVLDSLGRSSAA